MKFQLLASSSHGNAYIVSDRDTRILLECGVSYRKLQRLSGFKAADFSACLISHEHKDHSACVQNVISSGVPVYMSEGTAVALGVEGVETISAMKQFRIGTIDIVPFTTFHDAAEPLGFLFRSQTDGESLAFATDTVNLRYQFQDLTMLAIEANFDKEILALCDRMPEKIRYRITNTHMEIGTLCDYLKTLDLSRCREIFLLHLSDATSREWEFAHRVRRVVPRATAVTVCKKESQL